MAEGVGFEPTVELPLLLISSQMPLTTQPPFQPLIINNLHRVCVSQFDFLILQSDTACVKSENSLPPDKIESSWQRTSYANLIRYAPSGKYFARIRVGGKLIRQSLKTNVLSVAKLKLADLEKQERSKLEGQQSLVEGTAFFRDVSKEYVERLDGMPNLKPRTKAYYKERLTRLFLAVGVAVLHITPDDFTHGHFGFLGLLRLPLNHPGTAAVKFFTRIFEIGGFERAPSAPPVDFGTFVINAGWDVSENPRFHPLELSAGRR